jgi:hypothetical protein
VTDEPVLPESAVRYENGVAVALVAAGAGLTVLPPSIGGLTNLRHVDLDGNALTALPRGILRLPRLETLLLYGTACPKSRPNSAKRRRCGISVSAATACPRCPKRYGA